jgi:hypothetical protein
LKEGWGWCLGWAESCTLFLFLLCASQSVAQLTTGTITGTVADQSGAAVPGVSISVKNEDTGIIRTAATNARGRFEVTNLPVGNYEVGAALAGFQTTIRSGIVLTVGRNAVVDLTLQVGEVTQSVTVTGEAPLIETTTATVASLVQEKQVLDLPLNNRDLNQLAFLQPGVLRSPEASNVTAGMGEKLVVGGARGNQNLYLLDGVSSTDYIGGTAGASGAYAGAETVKEFQVITNNYSAEYQSAAGAIVSAVTKSGTNSFHGSLFEFLRNDNLDAARWEDNALGGQKPEFKRNQFGGSAGGPIFRDRTFFFGSYEGLRERLTRTGTAKVPSLQARAGILPSGTVTINAAVRPYLNLYPVPGQDFPISAGPFSDGSVEIAGTERTPTNDDFLAAKIDHQLGGPKAGFLSGTYNFQDGEQLPHPVLARLSGEGTKTRKHVVSTQHNSILSPTAVNQFKFGYTQTKIGGDIPLSKPEFGNLVFRPGRTRFGQIAVSGLTSIGQRHEDNTAIQKNLHFSDGVASSRGSHSMRFGGEINHVSSEAIQKQDGYNVDFTFNTLADFLTAQPESVSAITKDKEGTKLSQKTAGLFFQDNWALASSLTFNLGLRYEFQTVPEESLGEVSALLHFTDPEVTQGLLITNPTKKSFSPRFGFAWSPGSRKTALRGGYGIFYDSPLSLKNLRSGLSTMRPFIASGSVARTAANAAGRPLTFPNAFQTHFDMLLSEKTWRGFEYDTKNAYVHRWSLTLERELAATWRVSAGYTGARAVHLWVHGLPNMNKWQGWPDNPTGPKFFPAITGTNRINPAWASLRVQFPQGNSFYHGLALSAQKRLSHGLQLQLSYTYSKNIDESAALTGGEFAENQRNIYQAWDRRLDRALSSNDIRNNFAANFSYEPRLGEGLTGVSGHLVRGWQLNGIINVRDGVPLSVTDTPVRAQRDRLGETSGLRVNLIPGGNQNPVKGGPDQYYDPLQFTPATLGFFGNLGRNTLIGPDQATVDLSLFKNLRITEGSRVQFRAEFFNAFNRVNFGYPNRSPFLSTGARDETAGRITNTQGSARQIQFGLKYEF